MGSLVEPLTLHVAGPDEYLKVHLRDGNVEHVKGPASIWNDPIKQVKIQQLKALSIDTNEAIVVYRQAAIDTNSSEIHRHIFRGPMLYFPTGLEWLHDFSWHGTTPESFNRPVQVKLPGVLRFQKLRLTPDQTYFDVPNVRTRDDALITVKVMAFLQIEDIAVMLDATHDPISDVINSLNADVIDFAGSRSFEQFKADLEMLNSLDAYPNLVSRAKLIGYNLSKVVFRGYSTSPKLQEMHDESIQKRTELVLEKETQEQEQDLKDFKLERDSARAERLADFKLRRAQERQVIEKERMEHQEAVQDVRARAMRQRDLLAHHQALEIEAANHAQKLSNQRDEHACAAEHYATLKQLGVDLSRYLAVVARGERQHVIEVNNSSADSAAPQLHIHSRDGSEKQD